MSLQDTLADAMSSLKNAEAGGKVECVLKSSKIIKEVLIIMQKNDYIREFEYIDDGRGGKFRVVLAHKINNCKAIKPRHSVKKDEYEKWEKRYLPAYNIGILIISTALGMMTNVEAKTKKIGGKLIAFVY